MDQKGNIASVQPLLLATFLENLDLSYGFDHFRLI